MGALPNLNLHQGVVYLFFKKLLVWHSRERTSFFTCLQAAQRTGSISESSGSPYRCEENLTWCFASPSLQNFSRNPFFQSFSACWRMWMGTPWCFTPVPGKKGIESWNCNNSVVCVGTVKPHSSGDSKGQVADCSSAVLSPLFLLFLQQRKPTSRPSPVSWASNKVGKGFFPQI